MTKFKFKFLRFANEHYVWPDGQCTWQTVCDMSDGDSGAIMTGEYASEPWWVGVMGKGWHPCTLPLRHTAVGGGENCSGWYNTYIITFPIRNQVEKAGCIVQWQSKYVQLLKLRFTFWTVRLIVIVSMNIKGTVSLLKTTISPRVWSTTVVLKFGKHQVFFLLYWSKCFKLKLRPFVMRLYKFVLLKLLHVIQSRSDQQNKNIYHFFCYFCYNSTCVLKE